MEKIPGKISFVNPRSHFLILIAGLTGLFLIVMAPQTILGQDQNETLNLQEVTIYIESSETITLGSIQDEIPIPVETLTLKENFIESKEQLSINIYSFTYSMNQAQVLLSYVTPLMFGLSLYYTGISDGLPFDLTLGADSIPYLAFNIADRYDGTFRLSLGNGNLNTLLFSLYNLPASGRYDRFFSLSIGDRIAITTGSLVLDGATDISIYSNGFVAQCDVTALYRPIAGDIFSLYIGGRLAFKNISSGFFGPDAKAEYDIVPDRLSIILDCQFDIFSLTLFPTIGFYYTEPGFSFSLSGGRYCDPFTSEPQVLFTGPDGTGLNGNSIYYSITAAMMIKNNGFTINVRASTDYYEKLIGIIYDSASNANDRQILNDLFFISLSADSLIQLTSALDLSLGAKGHIPGNDRFLRNLFANDLLTCSVSLEYTFFEGFKGSIGFDGAYFRYDSLGGLSSKNELSVKAEYVTRLFIAKLDFYLPLVPYEIQRSIVIQGFSTGLQVYLFF